VQAKSGGSAVTLKVVTGSHSVSGGTVSFGSVGAPVSVPAGAAKLTVSTAAGSAKPVTANASLADGSSYTVVALGSDGGYTLQVLKDARAKGGEASLRVVHAAPELGKPDIKLGDRVIAQAVAFRGATPYVTVRPGSYELAVTKPGGKQMVFGTRVALSAGTATTAVIAGSGGAREKVILATDSTSAPAGAPKTGFGGLAGDGGPPWLLALLAALAAGAVGGAVQITRSRRTQ
jgi:hypothetical protein